MGKKKAGLLNHIKIYLDLVDGQKFPKGLMPVYTPISNK
jgi:hypothetical protein